MSIVSLVTSSRSSIDCGIHITRWVQVNVGIERSCGTSPNGGGKGQPAALTKVDLERELPRDAPFTEVRELPRDAPFTEVRHILILSARFHVNSHVNSRVRRLKQTN